MKTYCKHSRITEPAFVRDCIERFLNGKRSRRDVNDFLSRHPDLDSRSRQGHSRRTTRDQTMGARTIQQSVRETGRAQMLSKHQP